MIRSIQGKRGTEKRESKTNGETDIPQMVRVLGNQAALQRCGGGHGRERRRPAAYDVYELGEDSDSDSDPIPARRKKHPDDSPYSPHKISYLDSDTLRKNMNAQSSGGEAHHIIPSCIAERIRLSKDTGNQPWNGIILPGSDIMHPLSAWDNLPYHRQQANRNHSDYTAKVEAAIGTGHTIGDLQRIAQAFKGRIMAMGAGQFIDDI